MFFGCYLSSLLVCVSLFAVLNHGLSLPGVHQVCYASWPESPRDPPFSTSPEIGFQTPSIYPSVLYVDSGG